MREFLYYTYHKINLSYPQGWYGMNTGSIIIKELVFFVTTFLTAFAEWAKNNFKLDLNPKRAIKSDFRNWEKPDEEN